MARGLAERFGAVVMRLRNRQIGVHVAALVIDKVRVLPRSTVALHPKARVADDDFVDCGGDRNWSSVVGGSVPEVFGLMVVCFKDDCYV